MSYIYLETREGDPVTSVEVPGGRSVLSLPDVVVWGERVFCVDLDGGDPVRIYREAVAYRVPMVSDLIREEDSPCAATD